MKNTKYIKGNMDKMRLDATKENVAVAPDANKKPTILFSDKFKGKTKPKQRGKRAAANRRGVILNLLNEIDKAEHGSAEQKEHKVELLTILLKDFPASVIHNVVVKDRVIHAVNDGSIVQDTQIDNTPPRNALSRPSTFKLVIDAASIITGAALISLEALRLYRNIKRRSKQ